MDQFNFIDTPSGARLRTATYKRSESSQAQGVCVLLSGRSEFIEKYEEVIGELCGRGFDVATFDWRGQGGSSRALENPLSGHVGDFSEYDEDLAIFLEEIVKPMNDASPLVLAHSMGAHLALRRLRKNPATFRAAVFSAPMNDVYGRKIARFVIPWMNWLGLSGEPFSKNKATDPLKVSFEHNLITSDRGRYAKSLALMSRQPELRLGAPTWGWLKAANKSLKLLMSNGFAEDITTPILICGAANDRICITKAAREFAHRLPQGGYVEFEKSEHEILMESDAIRSLFWQAFDEFFSKKCAT